METLNFGRIMSYMAYTSDLHMVHEILLSCEKNGEIFYSGLLILVRIFWIISLGAFQNQFRSFIFKLRHLFSFAFQFFCLYVSCPNPTSNMQSWGKKAWASCRGRASSVVKVHVEFNLLYFWILTWHILLHIATVFAPLCS